MIAKDQLSEIAKSIGLDYASIMAFIATESPMKGFVDGRLLIQFEPSWFRKKEPFAPSGKWSVNKVYIQSKEWEDFNNAFSINANSAMESTSIGLPQIMGLHWKILGYKSVGEMWDDFKKGEYQQVCALAKYINADKRLLSAIKSKAWSDVASIYNGKYYKELAVKLGREPYDITMAKNYAKFSV